MKINLIDREIQKKIKKLKDKLNLYEKKIHEFKKEYKDDIAYCRKKLSQIRVNFTESLFNQLLTSTKSEIEKVISQFDILIEKLSKFALSEVAWTRAKDLELKMTNPFLYHKIRREFDSILSRLEDLDSDMLHKTEGEYKKIIKDIDKLSLDFSDERRTTTFSICYKMAALSITFLLGIYGLIATNFIQIGNWIPITVCSIIIFIILSIVWIPIFSWFKLLFNLLKNRKYMIIFLILFLILLIISVYLIYQDFQRTQDVITCFTKIKQNETISPEIRKQVDEDIEEILSTRNKMLILSIIAFLIPVSIIIYMPYLGEGKNILILNKLKEIENKNF
jgi:hypothetical protein